VVIPADIVKETIRDNLWQAILESPPENIKDILRETFIESPPPELQAIMWEFFLESLPPQLAGLPPAELEPYFNEFVAGLSPEELDPYLDEFIAAFPLSELEAEFNQYFEEFSQAMPASIELTEDVLGPEIPAQIAEALADAEATLSEVRQYISYFQTGFVILIVFMLLSVAGIILLNRQVRGISRILGIIFLSYGVLELIGILIARNIAEPRIPWADMPTTLQTWLQQMVGSFMTPIQILSITLIVVGAALLAVSFLYRRNQSAGEPKPESPTTV
jgi:multisubunit Na+/H+ antiporter MnhC subunit